MCYISASPRLALDDTADSVGIAIDGAVIQTIRREMHFDLSDLRILTLRRYVCIGIQVISFLNL